jgi:CheY-like chemotaxis protein
VAAASAEAALDHLRAGRGACLVILDLALPGMDGAALRAALLAVPGLADLPVVVYSARAHIPELPRVAAHLRKTTDPEVLLRVVERACRPRPPEAG